MVFRGAHDHPADGHRRRPRQHRHRQRSALPRHRRQQPVQPRHRQAAGSLRSTRHARADGADARRSMESRDRRQGRDHRPGRRDSRDGRTGRPRRLSDQRQEDHRRQLRRRRWRMGNQSHLLHDAGGAQAVRRPQSLGSRGRQVDGSRHRERAEIPRVGTVPEIRGRGAARGGQRVRRRRRRDHRPGVREHEGTGLHRSRARTRLAPSSAKRSPSSIAR